MTIENGAGKEPIVNKNKSKVAFDALQEQLKSNSKLDFVAGFHQLPNAQRLDNFDGSIFIGDSVMFVVPKVPTLELKQANALITDLWHEFRKDVKTGSFHMREAKIDKEEHEMKIGGLFFHEDIDTVEAATTTVYGWGEDSVLTTIPVIISPAPSIKNVKLRDWIEIKVFPDKLSAFEAVEKWENGDRGSGVNVLTSEQIKTLERRNKKRLK